MDDGVELQLKILMSWLMPDDWTEEMFLRWVNNWFTREILTAHLFLWDVQEEDIVFGSDTYYYLNGAQITLEQLEGMDDISEVRVVNTFEMCQVIQE